MLGFIDDAFGVLSSQAARVTMSTSNQLKPIKVWGKGGPNPPKVAIVLKELDIPHEIIPIPLSDVKGTDYVAINPNGRLPSIQDPNTDITLWESGAIILYLMEKYDADHKLSFEHGTPEYFHAQQWLFFQTSGQGPYYGRKHKSSLECYIMQHLNAQNRGLTCIRGGLVQEVPSREAAQRPRALREGG